MLTVKVSPPPSEDAPIGKGTVTMVGLPLIVKLQLATAHPPFSELAPPAPATVKVTELLADTADESRPTTNLSPETNAGIAEPDKSAICDSVCGWPLGWVIGWFKGGLAG